MRSLYSGIALFSVLAFSIHSEEAPAPAAEPLALSNIAPDKVSAGMAIYVKTILRNNSGQPCGYYSAVRPTFNVAPDDSVSEFLSCERPLWWAHDHRATIVNPNESKEFTTKLNYYYDLTLPGNYSFNSNFRFAGYSTAISPRLKLTITEPLFPIEDIAYGLATVNDKNDVLAPQNATAGYLKLSISIPTKNVQMDDLVKLKIKLENVGSTTVNLPGVASLDHYTVIIKHDIEKLKVLLSSDHNDVFKTRYYRNYTSKHAKEAITLAPKESMSLTVPLNFLFGIKDYSVYYVKLTTPIGFSDRAQQYFMLESNIIPVRMCSDVKRANDEDAQERKLKEE